MFVHYRTLGFILKKADRGEADQLLTVFTRDFGKLEILAKAVRKISSKLRPGAELFYLSEIEFIQGKGRKTLTDAILIDKFENIRKDLKRLKIAYRVSEVFDDLVREEGQDRELWDLLKETFEKLNNQQSTPKEQLCDPTGQAINNQQLLYHYFFWNLLSLLGYRPELYHCALCQKKLSPENLYFSPGEGGIICSQCRKLIKSAKEIDLDVIKILRIILKKDWTFLSKLKVARQSLKSLAAIAKEYYLYIRPSF